MNETKKIKKKTKIFVNAQHIIGRVLFRYRYKKIKVWNWDINKSSLVQQSPVDLSTIFATVEMSEMLSRAIQLATTYKSRHWRNFASDLLEKNKFNLERSIDFISTPYFQKEIENIKDKRIPALSIPEPGMLATRAEVALYKEAAQKRKTKSTKFFSGVKKRIQKYLEKDYAAHVKAEMDAAVRQIADRLYDGDRELAEEHYLLAKAFERFKDFTEARCCK